MPVDNNVSVSCLGAFLYAQQHAAHHDELARADHVPEPALPCVTRAQNETSRIVSLGNQDELPDIAPSAIFLMSQHDGAVRFYHRMWADCSHLGTS